MRLHGIRHSTRSLATRLTLMLVLALTLVTGTMVTRPEPAEAHAPCLGQTHSHWHFGWGFSHTDYWVSDVVYFYNGTLYHQWRIDPHGDYRTTRCT